MCEILSKISHRRKATVKNIFNAVALPISIPVWKISSWRDKIGIPDTEYGSAAIET